MSIIQDEDFNEMAKSAAMEIGLTEDEAEREVDEFNCTHPSGRFCEDCGVQLNDGVNCADFMSEYCNGCWNKFLEEYFPNVKKELRQEALNEQSKQTNDNLKQIKFERELRDIK